MNRIRSMGPFEWLLLVTLSVLWGGSFFAMGILNNLIPFSLIFWGQTQISSSLASILNATTPLWAVLLAHFLTNDEKLTAYRLFGVIPGFVGIVIMIGPDALAGLGANVLGQTAVVGRPWALIRYGCSAGMNADKDRRLHYLIKRIVDEACANGNVCCRR